jgi:hypothetical protein
MTEKPKEHRRHQRSAKRPRRAHVHDRHSSAKPPPEVPLQAVPISIDGCLIGELHVQPGTEEVVTTRAIATLAALRGWSQLGAELADLGEHRLEIAAHAARVAAAGGRGLSAAEEERIVDWFRSIVLTAIHRGGARAARAIWFVLVSDNQRDPHGAWMARCPVLEAIGIPPTLIEGFESSSSGQQELAEWLSDFPMLR